LRGWRAEANRELTWFVFGSSYWFCFRPCIVEFACQAEEQPGKIQEPRENV